MAEQGFVYVSEIELIGDLEGPVQSDLPDDSFEFVQQHGYGIAIDIRAQVASLEAAPASDPNDEIRQNLSPEELQKYEEALSGLSSTDVEWRESDGAPLDPETGEILSQAEFTDRGSDGCLPQAYMAADGERAQRNSQLFMSDEYADLQSRIQSDARLAKLYEEWSACMARDGYRYISPDHARFELADAGSEIVHEVGSDHHDVSESQKLTLLDKFSEREVRIAVADWNCSGDLFEQAPRIAREYEVEFINNNEGLIVALLDRGES